eukprot:TRINITY_DN3258_c0_g3_i2.p1 TRINITY_DN3258_c0_g3~~TRINITY_DN3258_c0_g3_i2.p1  ORF type:complete len:547 (+),score=47.74 TRINITY_DN3258_c0_g3_i2:61-1641(+)
MSCKNVPCVRNVCCNRAFGLRQHRSPMKRARIFIQASSRSASLYQQPVQIEYESDEMQQLIENKQLTNLLRKQSSSKKLLFIISQNLDVLNYINLSAAFVALGYMVQRIDRQSIQIYDIVLAYEALLTLVEEREAEFTSRQAANCIWSLGRATEKFRLRQKIRIFDKIYSILIQIVLQQQNRLTCTICAMTLVSMAKVKWMEQEHIDKIVRSCLRYPENSYYIHQSANILWAFATLGFHRLGVIKYFLDQVKCEKNWLNSQNFANILWALNKCRYHDPEWMRFSEELIIKKKLRFSVQEISQIVLAFANLGVQKKYEVFEVLLEQFQQQNIQHEQSVINTVYTLSLLNYDISVVQNLIDSFFFENLDKYKKSIEIHYACQLRRAQLQYKSRNQQLYLPANLEKLCIKLNQQKARQLITIPNGFYKEVYGFLVNKFVGIKGRVLIENDELEIKITLKRGKKKIAIELVVHTNCMITVPFNILGTVLQYHNLLERLGWWVVVVNAYKWQDEGYQNEIVQKINQILREP